MAKEKSSIKKEISPSTPLASKRRKRKKWPAVVIVIFIIGGAVYFFKQPILNGLRTFPLIGSSIPGTGEEKIRTTEELELLLQEKVNEADQLKAQVETLQEKNNELIDKNNSLSQYESLYMDFMRQKEAWDEQIAKTNPDLFIEQFEKVYPDAAERIYTVFKEEKVLTEKQRTVSKTIAQMDEDQAAKVLEALVATDADLVQSILAGMSTDERALILNGMSTTGAAQVIKLISPDMKTTK